VGEPDRDPILSLYHRDLEPIDSHGDPKLGLQQVVPMTTYRRSSESRWRPSRSLFLRCIRWRFEEVEKMREEEDERGR